MPFFFKQWGGVNKKKAGRLLGGRTYDEMPQITQEPSKFERPPPGPHPNRALAVMP